MSELSLLKRPSFLKVCDHLDMPLPHVLGHLRFMFDLEDAGFDSEASLESAAEWEGDTGALVKALIAEHLLEQDGTRLTVAHNSFLSDLFDYWTLRDSKG